MNNVDPWGLLSKPVNGIAIEYLTVGHCNLDQQFGRVHNRNAVFVKNQISCKGEKPTDIWVSVSGAPDYSRTTVAQYIEVTTKLCLESTELTAAGWAPSQTKCKKKTLKSTTAGVKQAKLFRTVKLTQNCGHRERKSMFRGHVDTQQYYYEDIVESGAFDVKHNITKENKTRNNDIPDGLFEIPTSNGKYWRVCK